MKYKLLLIAFFCFLVFPFASATIINVPENFTTIQDAVNNASDGDIIIVNNGTYNENIVINKSLILLGKQNGIDAKTRSSIYESEIRSMAFSGTFEIKADNVIIDGFKITEAFKGIHVTEDSSNITIRNNILIGTMQDGINLWRASSADVENNFISDINTSAITGGDDRGTPATGDDLITKATIKNNLIEDSRFGITGYQKNSVIEGNVVRNYFSFIDLGAGIGGQFTGVNIRNNNITGYTNSAGFALSPYENRPNSSNIKFENNILTDNYAGIYVNQYLLNKLINISQNKIFENSGYGAINLNLDPDDILNAKYNYWGSCEDPSSALQGYIDYEPWVGVCAKNQNISSECILENESVILNAEISGYCLSEVIFSVLKNSLWTNYSSNFHIGNNYSLELENLNSSDYTWKVYVKDCLNNVNESIVKEFYVYPNTILSVNPPSPNGENGWYLTNPLFSLINPNASLIYYRWDSQEILVWSTPFGFEHAPNNQNITGGIIDLNYWGQLLCGRNESMQSKIIKSDLIAPEIKSLFPANNSYVYDLKPKISALLKDKINADSGINISSLILKLDGEIKTNPTIINKSDLDYGIEYTPSLNLSYGIHNVSVYIEDYSGRSSEVVWEFKVNEIEKFNLSVSSPEDKIYGSTRIQFNITTDKKVSLIEYIDWNSGRKIRLCTNCDNYGYYFNRIKPFRDGEHNITIRATNEFGFSREENISFFIDSKAPKIYSTFPKMNKFTGGSDFYVKFIEENVKQVTLAINNTHFYNVSDCSVTGKYHECYADINLSEFEGKEIMYFFNVSDYLRSTNSRSVKIKVDTLAPEMEIISPVDSGNYTKKVNFEIKINETNLASVSYVYNYSGKEREVLLCAKLNSDNICHKTKSFAPGEYQITVKAEDKTGKVIGKSVEFSVK